MNWLQKWKEEEDLREKSLSQRTMPSDEQLLEVQDIVQIQMKQERERRERFVKQIRAVIEIAEEYISIGSWKKALETLKHLYGDKAIPTHEQEQIKKLYELAYSMMEKVRKTDPGIPLFTHFNLPTDDVN